MKKTIILNESDGYGPGSRCRIEKKFGRLELLTAFFDGPPFWFVRLRGHTKSDAEILKERIGLAWLGNGHFRFTDRKSAEIRFTELCAIPEYIAEAQKAEKLRVEKKERALAMIRSGKLKPFQPNTQNTGLGAFPSPI